MTRYTIGRKCSLEGEREAVLISWESPGCDFCCAGFGL